MPRTIPSVKSPRRKWSDIAEAMALQNSLPTWRWIPSSPRTTKRRRDGTMKKRTPLRADVAVMPSRRNAFSACLRTSPQNSGEIETRISPEVWCSAARIASSIRRVSIDFTSFAVLQNTNVPSPGAGGASATGAAPATRESTTSTAAAPETSASATGKHRRKHEQSKGGVGDQKDQRSDRDQREESDLQRTCLPWRRALPVVGRRPRVVTAAPDERNQSIHAGDDGPVVIPGAKLGGDPLLDHPRRLEIRYRAFQPVTHLDPDLPVGRKNEEGQAIVNSLSPDPPRLERLRRPVLQRRIAGGEADPDDDLVSGLPLISFEPLLQALAGCRRDEIRLIGDEMRRRRGNNRSCREGQPPAEQAENEGQANGK